MRLDGVKSLAHINIRMNIRHLSLLMAHHLIPSVMHVSLLHSRYQWSEQWQISMCAKASQRWALKVGSHAEGTRSMRLKNTNSSAVEWAEERECSESEEHYCLFGFRRLQCFQDNDSGAVMFVMLGSSGSQITDKTEHYNVADLTQQTGACNCCLLSALTQRLE